MTKGATMNSIDNLREYALTAASVNATTRAVLAGYVDEIEREVEEVRDREYRNGMEDGEMAAERDGWVRLPLDADGVPIHVEDVMEWPYGNGEFRGNGIGGNTLFYIDKDSGECEWTAAGDKHHHHAPTVEDVLREFAEGLGVQVADSYVAATAAKLALRGDE